MTTSGAATPARRATVALLMLLVASVVFAVTRGGPAGLLYWVGPFAGGAYVGWMAHAALWRRIR